MRRPYFELATTCHLPFSRRTSITAPPCAAISMSTSSGGHVGEHHALDVLPLEAGEHQLFVGVFEIHREQSVLRRVGRARHREVADEVAVVAELLALRGGASASRGSNAGAPGDHRVAPADQHVGVVARRHVMVFVDAGLDLVEAEARGVSALRAARRRERQRAHGRGDGGDAERALEDVAAAEPGGDHVADGRVVGRIAADILGFFIGARPREHFPHGNLLQRLRNSACLRLFQAIAVP